MQSRSDSHNEADGRKRLMSLMTRHQRQIFSYIFTLIPDRHAAEDLLQETCVVICEKFDDFAEGTDFVAWACQIAWWKIRESRLRFARSKVAFDQQTLESVARTAAELGGEMDQRHQALADCLKKLHPRDRELVLARYEPGAAVSDAARRSGRSLDAAYKALNRIRKLLFDCVSHRLAAEGTA